ncbi:MAG: hypothetical protein WD011_04780 [Nitriliruptoraceae bacterium]
MSLTRPAPMWRSSISVALTALAMASEYWPQLDEAQRYDLVRDARRHFDGLDRFADELADVLTTAWSAASQPSSATPLVATARLSAAQLADAGARPTVHILGPVEVTVAVPPLVVHSIVHFLVAQSRHAGDALQVVVHAGATHADVRALTPHVAFDGVGAEWTQPQLVPATAQAPWSAGASGPLSPWGLETLLELAGATCLLADESRQIIGARLPLTEQGHVSSPVSASGSGDDPTATWPPR